MQCKRFGLLRRCAAATDAMLRVDPVLGAQRCVFRTGTPIVSLPLDRAITFEGAFNADD
jgi:hypothetical protein